MHACRCSVLRLVVGMPQPRAGRWADGCRHLTHDTAGCECKTHTLPAAAATLAACASLLCTCCPCSICCSCPPPPHQVVVIGGGDTGTDCIGTSVRHGAHSVSAGRRWDEQRVLLLRKGSSRVVLWFQCIGFLLLAHRFITAMLQFPPPPAPPSCPSGRQPGAAEQAT